MLKKSLLILGVITSLNSFSQINDVLIEELKTIKSEDQKWRNLHTDFENGLTDTLGEKRLVELIQITDSLNYLKIKSIFSEHGFLGCDKVGKEGSHQFWLIVQHQDEYPDFQESVLEQMRQEVEKGNASSLDYAYLVDRVKVNTSQLQVYGTQMQINSDSTSFEPKPVMEREKIDERRKKVKLPPIRYYIQLMNDRYIGSLIPLGKEIPLIDSTFKKVKTLEEKKEYLEKIMEDDQKDRGGEAAEILLKYGKDSKEFVDFTKRQWKQDRINLIKIEKYIDKFGYPKKEIFGKEIAKIPYFVIHHAKGYEARERNFEVLYEAYLKGDIGSGTISSFLNRMYRIRNQQMFRMNSPFKIQDEIDQLIIELNLEEEKEEAHEKVNNER